MCSVSQLFGQLTYFGTTAVVGKTKAYQLEYPILTVVDKGCLGREAKHIARQIGIVSISTICCTETS